MATIDAFQGAEGSVDAQRRALLTAIAQQGSAGKASFDAEQQAAQAARQQAVSGAAERAGQINAPAGLAQQLAATGSAAAYGADASAGRSAMGSYGRNLAAASGNYMDQVKAAIPISRQLAESYQADALLKQQQAEQARKDDLWDLANRRKWDRQDHDEAEADQARNRQWDLEDRAYELDQRKTAGGAGGLAALVKSLGGSDLAKTQLRAVALQALKQAETPRMQKEVVGGKLIQEKVPGHKLSPEQKVAVLDGLGTRLGLEPGLLHEFLGKDDPTSKPKAKDAKPNAATIERVRNKPRYQEEIQEALDSVAEWRDEGYTLAEARARVAAAIRSDASLAKQPILRDLVIKDALSG